MLSLLATYWWAAGLVGLAVVYALLRKLAKSKVKSAILSYLKTAEKSVFANADSGVPLVADAVYVALPKSLKLFVPRAVFDTLVTELYNEAKKLIDAEATKAATVAEVVQK